MRWLLRAVLLCAPLALGAKGGCEPVVVGEDCAPGVTNEACPKRGSDPEDPNQKACAGLQGLDCDAGEYCHFAPGDQCGAADQTGVCTPIPQACDLVYSPVCGCDDKTYSSPCDAASKGVSVALAGACNGEVPPAEPGKVCGGLLGQGCDRGEYCDYPVAARCGAADQTGVCTPIPEACADVYAPVCGCDDKTYGNACYAAGAGVSVASAGECKGSGNPPPPAPPPAIDACGGLRGLGCVTGEYCSYAPEAHCGAADQTGVCTPIPEACTQEYSPVCGCDDKTYGNACSAAAAGISVAALGECGTTGGSVCGGLRGQSCVKGEYCNYPPDAHCGFADQTGVCAPIPEACTKEYRPVCGCDGKTYSNRCVAASAGVSVASDGECKTEPEPEPKNCGGIAALQCENKNEYCNYPVETRCGSGDQFGTCAVKPELCTQEYAPVCGCDGKTYGNSCGAASAGVSVQSEGECSN